MTRFGKSEMRKKAQEFALKWRRARSEKADSQTFWNEFFAVFGIVREQVAEFEKPVPLSDGGTGSMDVFWRKVLLIEQKSEGGNLRDAQTQAQNYLAGVDASERPHHYLVCDFRRFVLRATDTGTEEEFSLAQFPDRIERFDFIFKWQAENADEFPLNREASELMGGVYDTLTASGYAGEVELLLVRLLFCLFADDTGIFNKNTFHDYLQDNTREDGGNLGQELSAIFQTLNTPMQERQTTIGEDLNRFPHVNGELFAKTAQLAAFNADTRAALLRACEFDWRGISPAIFGALFQSIRNPRERRSGGEHYTSERNILKIIKPLFLDGWENELKIAGRNRRKLRALQQKLAAQKFLDPACGCGNFLIVAYRELRLLEMEILDRLYPRGPDGRRSGVLNIADICRINVDAFYGIEKDPFAMHIAKVAMWLTDHQMNNRLSELFGEYFMRIPLTTSPNILCGNALTTAWEEFIDPQELSFILGNPPFVGKQLRAAAQQKEMKIVFGDEKGAGVLDYVAAWYYKAAKCIRGTDIRCAFVSTNSIAQGEQAGILWALLRADGIRIHFAHRTFRWSNEARGVAHVYVVIVGFGVGEGRDKIIYEYDDIDGEPRATRARNINSYLVDAESAPVFNRTKPLCNVPEMTKGSMPNDGGVLLFSDEEKEAFLQKQPQAECYFRRFIGAYEFINNIPRWCLWLKDAPPQEIGAMRHVLERIESVGNTAWRAVAQQP